MQGYPSGTSWGFPKGKLEEGEADIDAAVREVYEEIGFDIRQLIVESQYLDASVKDSHARMYIIPGVPEGTEFQPKTRNEIRVSACSEGVGVARGRGANCFLISCRISAGLPSRTCPHTRMTEQRLASLQTISS